jgi:Fe-S cluster biosynthesis and repair protein YggX
MISFRLDGEAEWRGGLAQGPDNYILSRNFPVECGVNRVLIRSTTNAGKVVLTAESKGLKSDSVTIKSIPVKTEAGLSLDMPYNGLMPKFRRGPTPLTPSFVVSVESLDIVSARGGTNSESVSASYDDNELSDWVNDGNFSTAWIEYTLKKKSTVNEVNLKLNNFRSRTYPLRILVDNKVVFEGNTEKSLGYFKAVCRPTKGRRVTIQLMAENSGKDDASIGTEVGGKKLDDGIARDDAQAKGTLSIIEAEILQKANKPKKAR